MKKERVITENDITIQGEQAYPIYIFSFTWYTYQFTDRIALPNGLCLNSTSFRRMFRKDPTPQELEDAANKQIDHIQEKNKDDYVVGLKASIKFFKYETWNLEWFCHCSFNVTGSDSEILMSFERFVGRMDAFNRKNTTYENGHESQPYCLMGAEDRGRWRGEEDGDDAPCRCEGCSKFNVVRINH